MQFFKHHDGRHDFCQWTVLAAAVVLGASLATLVPADWTFARVPKWAIAAVEILSFAFFCNEIMGARDLDWRASESQQARGNYSPARVFVSLLLLVYAATGLIHAANQDAAISAEQALPPQVVVTLTEKDEKDTYLPGAIVKNESHITMGVVPPGPEFCDPKENRFASRKAIGYLRRGVMLEDKGGYESAKNYFDAAIKESPKYDLAYRHRAHVCHGLGYCLRAEATSTNGQINATANKQVLEYANQAEEDLRTVVKLNNGAVEDQLELASFLNNEAKYSQALQVLNGAIQAKPDAYGLYIERAETYKNLKQPEQQITDLRRVLAHEPGNEAVKKDLSEASEGLSKRD